MCGIAGVINFDCAPVDHEDLSVLERPLISRGPDGYGVWVNRNQSIALLHRRLAIFDLSKDGHQPMSRDGRVIVFNGEIYNFKDLKAELRRKGYSFQSETDTLEDAQNRKYQKLAELADIQPGERVLEIGCGWGGFAEYAAKEYGAHVTGITISKEQYDFTKNRLRTAGLDHMTDIVMQDYRKLNQRFDKIVSIEMFEAVGEKYWPVYFKTIANCLKDGGKAALQVITIDHKAFLEYRTQPDFIQKYIFPGGMLPSIKALDVPLKTAGLSLHFCQGYGQDYARTLAEWKVRFHQAWPELATITKFDDRFKRMWELYLSYCEGGFKAGMIDVKQMLITHK